MDLYSIAWQDWRLKERLALLDEVHIHYEVIGNCISINQPLSSGQREILEFARDPIHPVKFYILDRSIGRKVLSVFYDFWTWRFDR